MLNLFEQFQFHHFFLLSFAVASTLPSQASATMAEKDDFKPKVNLMFGAELSKGDTSLAIGKTFKASCTLRDYNFPLNYNDMFVTIFKMNNEPIGNISILLGSDPWFYPNNDLKSIDMKKDLDHTNYFPNYRVLLTPLMNTSLTAKYSCKGVYSHVYDDYSNKSYPFYSNTWDAASKTAPPPLVSSGIYINTSSTPLTLVMGLVMTMMTMMVMVK